MKESERNSLIEAMNSASILFHDPDETQENRMKAFETYLYLELKMKEPIED